MEEVVKFLTENRSGFMSSVDRLLKNPVSRP